VGDEVFPAGRAGPRLRRPAA